MSYSSAVQRPVISNKNHIQTIYSPKVRLSITFPDVSPFTKQEFKDECDINILMAKYQATGEMPNLNESDPRYLDATGFDYQAHMNFVAGANSLFNALPSAIRSRFRNDPVQFLDFTGDEKNRDEMVKMGLLRPIDTFVTPYSESAASAAPAPAPAAPGGESAAG